MADFITTSHSSGSIANFLTLIRKYFENHSNAKSILTCLPPIVITDYSWALIHGVLEGFNSCDISRYLQWSYDCIFEEQKRTYIADCMKTRVVLCSTHFLKSIITKSKTIKVKDKKVKYCFIFCFSLLQNANSIEKFIDFFINIYNIFHQKYLSENCVQSLAKIKREILARNLARFVHLFKCFNNLFYLIFNPYSL